MRKSQKVTVYAYVGKWRDGTLGWVVPSLLHPCNTEKNPRKPDLRTNFQFVSDNDEFFLTKITLEPVKQSKRKLFRTAKDIRSR